MKKTFKESVKQIPYYKAHPEQFKREDWYYFPDDNKILSEDLTILLEDSDKKELIKEHIEFLVIEGRSYDIYHKESMARWVFDLHNL